MDHDAHEEDQDDLDSSSSREKRYVSLGLVDNLQVILQLVDSA